MNKIWWLASYPKSGNTWLRLFLSAYRYGSVDINRPVDVLADDIQEYLHHIVSPVPLSDLDDAQIAMLRPAALLHLCAITPPDRPLLCKTHFSRCILGGAPAIPPALTYGAVYLVRDPRDVACSYARHRKITLDKAIEDMATANHLLRRGQLYHLLCEWSTHVLSWTKDAAYPVLVVRYEDMVRETKATFRKIIAFLMHEVDEDRLHLALHATAFSQLQKQEQAHGFREKPDGTLFFTHGQPGGWRSSLSRKQVEAIKQAHAPMMREFGYL